MALPPPNIEATPDDIATANRLADAVLGTTLDELPPQTRRLLTLIRELSTLALASEDGLRGTLDESDRR